MLSKKMRLVLGSLFILLLIGMVSAESCSITERTNCEDANILMGLYSETNTHGQLASVGTYDYVVCCDFLKDKTCDGTNKIISLSEETNAHVEDPANSNYTYDVCYGSITCSAKEICEATEMGIFSISSDYDAHIGGLNDYDLNICCSGMCAEGEIYIDGACVIDQVAYWSNNENEFVQEVAIIPDETELTLKLIFSRLNEGDVVQFDIYENDGEGEGLIRTIEAIVDSEQSASIKWLVTEDDLEKASESFLEGDLDDFYFIVNGAQSNGLTLTPLEKELCIIKNVCRDYNQDQCEADLCGIGNVSVMNNNEDIVCGEETFNTETSCNEVLQCGCTWNSGDELCVPSYESVVYSCNATGPVEPLTVGECVYSESVEDDCSDGFLTYSWISNWAWADENNYGNLDLGDENYANYDGTYRYDPLDEFGIRLSEKCTSGENVLPCPAQVELPFFGIIQFISVLLIIALVYFILHKRKFF